jgi:hypothetical protein
MSHRPSQSVNQCDLLRDDREYANRTFDVSVERLICRNPMESGELVELSDLMSYGKFHYGPTVLVLLYIAVSIGK